MKTIWIRNIVCTAVTCLVLLVTAAYGAPAAPQRQWATSGYGGRPSLAGSRKFTPITQAQFLKKRPQGVGGFAPGLRQLRLLVSQASAVLQGTVQSAEDAGYGLLTLNGVDTPVVIRRVAIRVESSLKGAPVSSGTTRQFDIYVPHGPSAPPAFANGYRALFFIAPDGAAADLYYPTLPLGPLAVAQPASADPMDDIKRLVLLSLTPDASEDLVTSSANAVVELNIKDASDMLSRIATSTNCKSAVTALYALVRLGDARAFPRANDYILGVKSAPPLDRAMLIASVPTLSDSALAPFIIPLASSEDVVVRLSGLKALRHMRSAKCLPALAAALEDKDSRCQYVGMMGMAEVLNPPGATTQSIVGGGETVQYSDYLKEPAYYLTPWRDWWNNEGKAKYATVPSGTGG